MNRRGAHLHFQVMDRPSELAADGLPYVFDQYEVMGRTPSLAELEPYVASQMPIPIDPGAAGARPNALPLGRDVLRFTP